MKIPVSEATEQLRELAEAAINGETVAIVLDETHAVQLTPTRRSAGRRKAGSARGQITYADDFDDPLPGLEEYIA